MRPIYCRERLHDEGKSYPKSSCVVCGTLLRPNWSCPFDLGERDELSELKSLRRKEQEECDRLLDRVQEKRQYIKTLNMDINRLKRIKRENSQKDEGRRS